ACASLGYCLNLTGHPMEAVSAYRHALEAGFVTAGLQNDLAYSSMVAGGNNPNTDKFIENALASAITINPRFQAPYYNRAISHSDQIGKTLLSHRLPFDDMEKALEIGPKTPQLIFDAARFHAKAA